MVLTRAIVFSIARSLFKSLILSAVVFLVSMVLMAFSPQLATLALLGYSCTMIVKSSRQPLPLHWFTVLLPGAMALASFSVQMLLFAGLEGPASALLSFLAGLLPGILLGRAHKIFRQDSRLYAMRTYRYVLIWVLALFATQGGALIGLRAVAGYGVLASGFSTSMLVTLSACLLLKYLKERGSIVAAGATPVSLSWLAWLLLPWMIFGQLHTGQATIPVNNADEAAQIALTGQDFDRPLAKKWSSWQQFTDAVAPRSEQQGLREALDSIRALGRDVGTVGYFGKVDKGLYAQSKLVVVFNPAKWEWVTVTAYRTIYGLLVAWAKIGNQLVAAFESGSTYPTRFHAELCGKNCVAFSYQCGTFAISDNGPWTAIVQYQLLKKTINVNYPYVYENYVDPDLAKCFWQGVREDGLRLIKTVDARLRTTDYLDASGRKPEMGPIASLLSLIKDLLQGTGKFSEAAIAAGLAIALLQLLSGAGLTAAISSAETAAQESMRASAAAKKAGSQPPAAPPTEVFEIPPETRQPPLIDPDTGLPLVVHDGVSDYGKDYAGGKRGQVWYGDRWVDRETAAQWISEREWQLQAREDQRRNFLKKSAEEKIARHNKDIAQKMKDGYRYDDKTDTWYLPSSGYEPLPKRPDPHAGHKYDAMTDTWYEPGSGYEPLQPRPDPHAGYEYDKETDTWHLPGWEYDHRTGAWRDVKAETGGFEPTRIEPEKGDVTRAHIPAGALLPGDSGAFFDPKDLSFKELKDAAVRWIRTRIDGTEYEKIYHALEKRKNYLNEAEYDALEKYREVVAKLRQVRKAGGDPWLEQKLEEVYQAARKNLNRVQAEKLDLTYRVASGSKGGKQYRAYEQQYRQGWTVEKVAGEAGTLVKEMFVPNLEWVGPIVNEAVAAREQLQHSLQAQPELFQQHDELINTIKNTYQRMQQAQADGKPEQFKILRQQLDQQRGQLKGLTDEMNQIHKNNLRWQARTLAAYGAMSMGAQQIAGAAELQMQVGNSAGNYIMARMGTAQTKVSPLDMGREQRAKLYDWETKGAPRLPKKSGGSPPKGPGGAGTGDGTGGPKIPREFAEDYNALQRALANGDEVAANRHAARMAVKDYAKFKGMVDGRDIDATIGNRALNTHQDIINTGIKKGVERTHNMGRLLGRKFEVDADGNIMIKSPIERVYAPGSGMEPFNPANPRMPGDVDLSGMPNRRLCQQRGLDMDNVKQVTARNIRDAINEEAAARLGADVGDYCRKTKVKMFEPGTPEEVTSFSAGKMKGKIIDSSGRVLDKPTTLGREMYSGAEDISDIISRSRTGRAMDAADESIQIRKTIDEIYQPRLQRRQPSPEELTEGAREIGKHMGRSQQKVGWNMDNIDGVEAGFKAKTGKQGFSETLEVAQSGDPKAIKQAVNTHYDGDYSKFYDDCQTTSNHITQKQLQRGGKIWGEQADRLQQAGVSVKRQNIISHQAPKNESAGQYLERMGVSASEQKFIQTQRAAEADLADVVSRSKTCHAIDVADSSIRIGKAIDDVQGPRVSVDDQIDTTHTIGKQMESLQTKGRWNVDEMDAASVPLHAKGGKEGFAKTLDAAMGGDARAIKKNIQQHYDGNFNKFYDDCQQTCHYTIQKQLDSGGKILGEQADSLQRSGLSVDENHIISPQAPKDEGAPQFLERMGVSAAEQKQIRVQRAEERAAVLAEGGKPDLTGRTLDPVKTYVSHGAKATPGALPPENIRIALQNRPRLKYIDQQVREAWYWTSKGGAWDKPDSWDNFHRGLELKVAEGKLTYKDIDQWWDFMDKQWGRVPADTTGPEVFTNTRHGLDLPPLERPAAAGGATRPGAAVPGTKTNA